MHAGIDAALTPGGDLRLHQPAQEVRRGPVRGSRLLRDGVELGVGSGSADLQEAIAGELLVVDTHEAHSRVTIDAGDNVIAIRAKDLVVAERYEAITRCRPLGWHPA